MPNLKDLGGNYALGSTNPPTTLEAQGIFDPHPSEFVPQTKLTENYYRSYRLGSGICKWRFGMLSQDQFSSLMSYIPNGSTGVFIKTRVNDGNTPTYSTFYAKMNLPKFVPVPGNFYKDIEIEFTNLVAQ